MKLLLLPPYFYPEQQSSSLLDQHRYEFFAEVGFLMEVHTPMPTRGISQELRQEYLKKGRETMFDGLMSVHRFALMNEGHNPIGRACRYIIAFLKQYHYGRKTENADCIFLVSTPPIQGMLGALLKKKMHIPFIYNLQDVFPDSLVSTGMTHKGSILWKIGRVIENFTYRNADKIIVISNDFKRNIMAKGVPEDKIEVIYNWVDEQTVVNVPRENNILFDKYHLDRNKFYITYCGNIGHTQNLEMLVAASDKLYDNQNIHFVLVGNGAYWESLVAKLKGKRNLSSVKADDGTEALTFGNITLLPFQPYDDISHVFSFGDVGLIISKPGVGANSVPSKTWSIMSAERPVLANFDENEIKNILEGCSELSGEGLVVGGPCGIFTKAGDLDSFVEAIVSLSQDPELCRQMGANGHQFILHNLTKEIGTRKYVEVIKEVVNASKLKA